MRKALTIFITLLCQTVIAQDAQTVEFRNIPGRILKADNRPAQQYMVAYHGTEMGTSTDYSGKFDVNVPVGMPVLLEISDRNKLVFFYKVNPEDKSISIKIDEKTLKTSKELFAEWDKNKTKNKQYWNSVYNTDKFRIFAQKYRAMLSEDQDIVIAGPSLSAPVSNAKKIYQDYECEIKPASLTNGLKFPDFVKANLVYPELAKENNIQGKAFVSAVIEPDGSLSDIKIPRKLSPECDKEAIRLVKLAKWTPGTVGGKKVRTQLVQIILFQL